MSETVEQLAEELKSKLYKAWSIGRRDKGAELQSVADGFRDKSIQWQRKCGEEQSEHAKTKELLERVTKERDEALAKIDELKSKPDTEERALNFAGADQLASSVLIATLQLIRCCYPHSDCGAQQKWNAECNYRSTIAGVLLQAKDL